MDKNQKNKSLPTLGMGEIFFLENFDKFIEVVDIILLNKLLDNGKLSSNTGLLSSNFPLLDKLKGSTTFSLWINLSKLSSKMGGF